MIIVSNTTPLLSLHKIGRLDLLQVLFNQVVVPQAVFNEIALHGKGKQGHNLFASSNYIQIKQIENKMAADLLRLQLDYGEAETIVLAQELDADILIIDEKKARRIAQVNGKTAIGTIGILQLAKNKGLISNLQAELDALITNGIWIDRALYNFVLEKNNE